MAEQDRVAVIGAGVIGCAIAWALAKESHRVVLLDRATPGLAGASFGNAGHIAAELVEPLPSRTLLFGFWRELFAVGGALDIPLRRIPRFFPWATRFAAASGLKTRNTEHLAPLVAPALKDTARLLTEIGRPELLRNSGHYEVWFGPKAQKRAAAQAATMARLGIHTEPADTEAVRALAHATQNEIHALRFTTTGQVTDPWQAVLALAHAAIQRGAKVLETEVRSLDVHPDRIDIRTAHGVESVHAVVIAAGARSASLLEPLGLVVPLEAVRGYHVDLAGQLPVVDAPVLYSDTHILVTPMTGRLRASSYMDFVELEAPEDVRKSQRLLERLARLGYDQTSAGPSWWGARPILPDYLPGIGRAPGTNVFYAIGHQHLGLTLAAVTAELMADIVGGRHPRHNVAPFDLRRFGQRRTSPGHR